MTQNATKASQTNVVPKCRFHVMDHHIQETQSDRGATNGKQNDILKDYPYLPPKNASGGKT